MPYNPKLVARSRKLRKNMTPFEMKLWYEFLKLLPIRVHRQKIIGHYIVDFYIASVKLVIEIDGDSHFTDEALEYDMERTNYLASLGLFVLRFTNREVSDSFEGVCIEIQKYL